MVKRLAQETSRPRSILAYPAEKLTFFFVYFNVLSVLSAPTSRNTEILFRFPTLNELSNTDPYENRSIATICKQMIKRNIDRFGKKYILIFIHLRNLKELL